MTRIAYIANSTIPSRTANSIHVMRMCEALARLGHHVELNYPIRGDVLSPDELDEFQYYGVSALFSLHRISRPRIRGARYYFAFAAALRAKLRRVELAFCRNHWAAYFCARLGVDSVFEAHAPLPFEDRKGLSLFRRLIRSQNFRHLFVITNALRDHYLTCFPELEGRISVLPDAASPIATDIEPECLGKHGPSFKVGYVGQLYRGKGMELIAQLAPLCPEMSFHIVGGQDSDIKHWVDRCAGQGNLVFHGYVPHARVAAYIKAMDVVLLPNQFFVSAHGNGERNISEWTSPLKAFEYMAAGKAIIASDLPALREVMHDEDNALLCPPDAPDQWRVALERLASNPVLSERLSAKAYADFSNNYSWDTRAYKAMEIAG